MLANPRHRVPEAARLCANAEWDGFFAWVNHEGIAGRQVVAPNPETLADGGRNGAFDLNDVPLTATTGNSSSAARNSAMPVLDIMLVNMPPDGCFAMKQSTSRETMGMFPFRHQSIP